MRALSPTPDPQADPIGRSQPAPEPGAAELPGGRNRPIAWIELGRALAILAVIAIHVASPLVTRPNHVTSFWFGNLVESATRWCVPVFVMVSGYLLLSSPGTAQAGTFYRRRLAKVGPPLVTWTIAYLVFGHLVTGVPRDLAEAARMVGYGRPYFHLYFLYLIAGLYVVAPGLRVLAASLGPTRLLSAAAVCFVLAMIDAALMSIGGIGVPNAVTRFVPYVGYFLAGYAIAHVARTGRRVRAAVLVAVVGVLACAVGTAFLVGDGGWGLARGRYLYEYLSITTVPVSLAVFALLAWGGDRVAHASEKPGWDVVRQLGAASLGIYLVHPMVLKALEEQGITARMMMAPIGFAITAGLTLGATWIIVLIMRRLPLVRRVV